MTRTKTFRIVATIAVTVTYLAVGAVRAETITIEAGTTPAGDTDNVVFNSANSINGPALTVRGEANTGAFLVDFTGTENLVAQGGVGQAEVKAVDGGFKSMSIQLHPADDFGKIAFSLAYGNKAEGDVYISAYWSGGVKTEKFSIDKNLEKFFSIASDRSITQVGIASDYDVEGLKLVRIGQLQAVPVPAALWGGISLLGVLGGGRLWKRRREIV